MTSSCRRLSSGSRRSTSWTTSCPAATRRARLEPIIPDQPLTQTAFYSTEMMGKQAGCSEKECINQMAGRPPAAPGRVRRQPRHGAEVTSPSRSASGSPTPSTTRSCTSSTWRSAIGRTRISTASRCSGRTCGPSRAKDLLEQGHDTTTTGRSRRGPLATTWICRWRARWGRRPVRAARSGATGTVVVTDRVYEYSYLRGILSGLFNRARCFDDDLVLNLTPLAAARLWRGSTSNLPFLQSLKAG